MLSYELPSNNLNSYGGSSKSLYSSVVYNFHSLYNEDRVFIFVINTLNSRKQGLDSITDLFYSSNWLEREVSELSGINFLGKKDLRNLMLQYGDSTSPFQKSFPTVGLREVFFDPVKDTVIQNPVSLQI